MDESSYSKIDREVGESSVTEELRVNSETVSAKVRAWLREGNARRVVLKNDEGKALFRVPLTVAVIVTVLLPLWVGVGVVAALAAQLKFSTERRTEDVRLAKSAAPVTPDRKATPSHDSPADA